MKRAVVGLAIAAGAIALAPLAAMAGDDDTNGGKVCAGLSTGHISGNGQTSITISAPAGQLISKVCVKAGSEQNGNGPEYTTYDPPVSSVTITYPGGKEISHYSLQLVDKPTPTTSTQPTTEPPTTPPPTSQPPTTPPTSQPPTTPPTTEPPTTSQPPTTPPTTQPPTTPPTTDPTTTTSTTDPTTTTPTTDPTTTTPTTDPTTTTPTTDPTTTDPTDPPTTPAPPTSDSGGPDVVVLPPVVGPGTPPPTATAAPAPVVTGELPVTGSSSAAGLTALGVLVLGAGTGLAVAARRTRSTD